MLKVIGKYIEESGLDKILFDSDIYGEITLKQILALREKCPYTELFLVRIFLYSDQK